MPKIQIKVRLNFVMSADGRILPAEGSNDKTRDAEMVRFKYLLEEDAIDEIFLTIRPVIVGGVAVPSLTGLPEGFLPQERRFRLKSLKQHEGEASLHYLRDRRNDTV